MECRRDNWCIVNPGVEGSEDGTVEVRRNLKTSKEEVRWEKASRRALVEEAEGQQSM